MDNRTISVSSLARSAISLGSEQVVVEEVEDLQVLHAEQLGRHLRETHVPQLKTMCES